MNLENHLSTILGVAESVPRVNKVALSVQVPARPEPLYEYRILVRRTEYGTIYFTAASEDDAQQDCDFDNIDWNDYGDTDIDDVEQDSSTPVNQDKLDAWDDAYGRKFDTDGEPKCSDCGYCYTDDTKLTTDPDDPDCWYCEDCLPTHLSSPDAL